MKRLTTRFFVAVGLTSILVSVLLLAFCIDLVPDQITAIRERRAALSEATAASLSSAIVQSDFAHVQAALSFIVKRNGDLQSVAVRRGDGTTVAVAGDHPDRWTATDSQIRLPILNRSQEWGAMEFRFKPLALAGWTGFYNDPRVRMICFTMSACFFGFYFYLGRVLRQLDPARAVPERVRKALDTLAEGLLVVDTSGYIVLANQAFASWVGKQAYALTGRMTTDLGWLAADGTVLAKADLPWIEAITKGIARRNERIWLRDGAGRLRSFLVNSSSISGDGDGHGGALISFDDVTQLQEKELELRVAKDEAEAANRAKSDFLANISHEIRTPMNAVLGFTDLLRRGYHKNDAELKKHLHTIHSNGKHLLELIDDILDLAKVEAGRFEVEQAPCAPHAIIREVTEILQVRAQEKGIWLRFECTGPVPQQVMSDAPRLRQILTNLVGNAIKFTQTGGVKVVLGLRTQGGRSVLGIDVVDTGVGISQDRLEAIFEPFVQAENSTARRFGGTGLGLAISRQYARMLGGDITVASRAREGSVFTVTIDPGSLAGIELLTAEEAALHPATSPAKADWRWEFPSGRVLIVDDGEANRELVRLVLENVGLHVSEAESGRAGLEKATSESFDAVLMDLQMPDMDGLTVTRTLRESGLRTPIIALTADAMKGVDQKALTAGFDAYLTKPLDIDELLQTLASLTGGRRSKYVDLGTEKPVPTASPMQSPSQGPLTSRYADHPRLSGVVRKFAQEIPRRAEAIEQAWAVRDFQALAGLAHWLKGAGGTAGYDAFTEPARQLEQFAQEVDTIGLEIVLLELRKLVRRIALPEEVTETPC
jgi:PAS domain S-box-containing protein